MKFLVIILLSFTSYVAFAGHEVGNGDGGKPIRPTPENPTPFDP